MGELTKASATKQVVLDNWSFREIKDWPIASKLAVFFSIAIVCFLLSAWFAMQDPESTVGRDGMILLSYLTLSLSLEFSIIMNSEWRGRKLQYDKFAVTEALGEK